MNIYEHENEKSEKESTRSTEGKLELKDFNDNIENLVEQVQVYI